MRSWPRVWLGALVLSAVMAAAQANPAWGGADNAAGSAAQFLRVGAGARALGMGEAYGPVAEGPEAIYWNPAGLAQVTRPELSYSHFELLRYFHYDFIAYAQPVSALRGTVGGSASVFYQDSLEVVTGADQVIGTFRPHSEVFSLAFARTFAPYEEARRRDKGYIPQSHWNSRWVDMPFHESDYPWEGRMMMGLAVKAVTENLYDRRAAAAALDGGLLYLPEALEGLRLSAAFRNAGTRERFIRDSESLPAELALGAAYDARGESRRMLTAVELSAPYYGSVSGKVGVEYSRTAGHDIGYALRAGYKTLTAFDLGPLTGVTAGVGLRYGNFSLDFGFQPMATLGELYRMGLNIRF